MFRTENEIWKALLPIIKAGLTEFDGLEVKRAYQGATQADGPAPRLLLYRVSSRRCGAQGKHYRQGEPELVEISTWRKEDTFQAFALVDRAAEDAGYTARDALEALAANLQGETALAALRAEGLGILRINDIQETPYEDASNNWRFSVSLKFTVTYTQSLEREVPAVSRVRAETHYI
jgi:hypothetical protein